MRKVVLNHYLSSCASAELAEAIAFMGVIGVDGLKNIKSEKTLRGSVIVVNRYVPLVILLWLFCLWLTSNGYDIKRR
jgi:hypothetical protein